MSLDEYLRNARLREKWRKPWNERMGVEGLPEIDGFDTDMEREAAVTNYNDGVARANRETARGQQPKQTP